MAMLGGISHDVRTYATRLLAARRKISDEAERDRAIADINDMILLLDDALLASRAGAGELAEEMVEIDDIIRAEVADRRSGGARIDYQGGTGSKSRSFSATAWHSDASWPIWRTMPSTCGGSASSQHDRRQGLSADGRRRRRGNPPEHRQAMLEPFSRLETSRSRGTGGAGLGLAIARSLVEAHRRRPVDPASSIGRRQDLGPGSAVSIALIFGCCGPQQAFTLLPSW